MIGGKKMDNKKKEIYEIPQIEVIALSDDDIIRTSLNIIDEAFDIGEDI